MITTNPYKVKQYNLSGLNGISDHTLEVHFKLYEGYVKETNRLNEEIQGFLRGGKVDHEAMPEYSELKRRLGFEYNGMVLHEFYFGNLSGDGRASGTIVDLIKAQYGTLEAWEQDFRLTGSDSVHGLIMPDRR